MGYPDHTPPPESSSHLPPDEPPVLHPCISQQCPAKLNVGIASFRSPARLLHQGGQMCCESLGLFKRQTSRVLLFPLMTKVALTFSQQDEISDRLFLDASP